ncbi:oxidoreductase, short-chain dehydrogenase/reductase family protein [Reticulomyxa filosa]|uniref:Oxidoreductase, short-chain dehydrogenase/reductase family protein n=1 Tax=Reticulomyxa filosa TaxID=46433 RepID=X6LX95_RETFI|nr:oxidoreductase, short-chain dehydrogenase/reductase family protein [Reticulomyxa filosa]|eukprot:ETO05961.1 oxidoreductase, short-chain dehydrogenase/reductase family protein [Reticulomyxa filosa]
MSGQSEEKIKKPLIVITGASSGIGEACARYFYKEGHPLLLLARRLEKMEKQFGEMKNILIKKVDVTKYDEMQAVLEDAEKMYGPCDCLINNAGVSFLGQIVCVPLFFFFFSRSKINKKKRVLIIKGYTRNGRMECNDTSQCLVFGTLHGIKSVLKGMKERKHGTIINISSIAGKHVYEILTVYCATKFAIRAISEGLRAEAGTCGVRVITVFPGFVEVKSGYYFILWLCRNTEIFKPNKGRKEQAIVEEAQQSMPNGILQPEDIASAFAIAKLILIVFISKRFNAIKLQIISFFKKTIFTKKIVPVCFSFDFMNWFLHNFLVLRKEASSI